MTIYSVIYSNLRIKGRQSVGNPNLHFHRQIWDCITHNRAFVAAGHLRAFRSSGGVIEKVVI